MEKKTTSEWGTYEWSSNPLNYITGCGNDCLYCYSKEMSIRYNRSTPETWRNERVRIKDLNKKIKKYDAIVMYPSSHDIRPEHLEESIDFLQKILDAGNQVLIVSKPYFVCILLICERFRAYRDRVLFRFTIGSSNDSILKFWEPNAPDFNERLNCLKWAHGKGFRTSVSCEPMLDNNIQEVIEQASPFVTETIWLGKINHLIGTNGKGRLDFNGCNDPVTLSKAHELIAWQSDDNILGLYENYKNDPKIMWKESIKRVIGNHLSQSTKQE